MSDLTRFRDHARKMAAANVPQADRSLWTRLADEIDDYLDRPTESVDLFGEVTTEPDAFAALETS